MVGPAGRAVPCADLHQYLTAFCQRLVVEGDDDHRRIGVFRPDRDVAQLDRANGLRKPVAPLCLRGVERADAPAVIPRELASIAADHFPFPVDEAAQVRDLRLGRVRPINGLDRSDQEGQGVDGTGQLLLFRPLGKSAREVIVLILGDDRRNSLPELLVATMLDDAGWPSATSPRRNKAAPRPETGPGASVCR